MRKIIFSLSPHQIVMVIANADKFRKGMKKAVPGGTAYI